MRVCSDLGSIRTLYFRHLHLIFSNIWDLSFFEEEADVRGEKRKRDAEDEGEDDDEDDD